MGPEDDRKCTIGICQKGKCTPWKCQNGNCTPWKMTEKITSRKMTEISNLDNARIEISHPGKYQNGKCTTQKIPEQKLQALENDRKIPPWKITEKTDNWN